MSVEHCRVPGSVPLIFRVRLKYASPLELWGKLGVWEENTASIVLGFLLRCSVSLSRTCFKCIRTACQTEQLPRFFVDIPRQTLWIVYISIKEFRNPPSCVFNLQFIKVRLKWL